MNLLTFDDAEKFLLSLIPKEYKNRFRGSWGLERTKYFLKLLDNPQEKVKVIHIAGTSGKGSTAYLTSLLLASHNKKTGLHISPHMSDVCERFQINNELLTKEKFLQYLHEILPAFEKVKNSKFEQPSYFEFVVVLAFYIFEKENVEYAVIETGMGGWYDATNVVENPSKVAVITKIGLDHTEILGDTIDKIALQKAKIIQKNNLVVSIDQEKEARDVVEKVAQEEVATLYFVEPKEQIHNIKLAAAYTQFDFVFYASNEMRSSLSNNLSFKLQDLQLGLLGAHQAENASVALTTFMLLAKRDNFVIEETKIRQVFETAHFAGRMELFELDGKKVIIDGAHNPQKMETFLENLTRLLPNQKFQFVVAFKKDKDITSMLRLITPIANNILITSFSQDTQDMVNISEPQEKVAEVLDSLNFKNYKIIENPKSILFEISKQPEKQTVITGSLYLISEIYPILKKQQMVVSR